VAVPLSEREQQILDEIEKNLYEEDPGLARRPRRPGGMTHAARLRLGVVVFTLGFAVLIAFFLSRVLLIDVIAFGAMVAGIVLAAGSVKGLGESSSLGKARLTKAFSQIEQRLRQRYRK
jgi:hypothetical protein